MSRMITLSDNCNLSMPAKGVLGTMLNYPESDYHTAHELCSYFKSDSLNFIQAALDELVKAGYVLQLENGAYAVNKLKIPQMKVRTL